MRYRRLGNSGLIISELSLGTMQFGRKMNMGGLGQQETDAMVRFALDQGINVIDTADVYGLGESETLIGNAKMPILTAQTKRVFRTPRREARGSIRR